MAEQIQATITGVSATADELIAHLSRNLEDQEIEYWENPDNYVLKRTHALGIEEEITDEAVSYDDEIPGVVFPVKTPNVERDVLKLIYTSPDGNYEYSTVFETEPTPDIEVYARTDQLIAHLSRPLEVEEIEYWENPNIYDLKRIHANGEEEEFELTDEDISYDAIIPGLVFQLETPNVPGDTLYLTYTNPDGEAEPYSTVFEGELYPKPGDPEWIEKKLTMISDAVHVIQARLPALEDAAKLLTDNIQGIVTSLGDLDRKATRIEALVGNLDGKLDTVDASIGRVDGNLTALTTSAIDFANQASGYTTAFQGKLDRIITAVVTNVEEPLLEVIDQELKSQRAYLGGPPTEHGEKLAETIIGNWHTVLNLFDQVYKSIKVPQQAKQKVQLVQTGIRKDISYMGAQKQLIRRRPTLVKDEKLIFSAVAGITETLASLEDIKKTVQYGGIRR